MNQSTNQCKQYSEDFEKKANEIAALGECVQTIV